ncbi:uncharacterized protein KY384_002816 [Bacidia gigantensis]|uniref:uncharacterized protein n=1 Tax=Bacidia gigantensis TaxID=2732470 RepID=UPI001D0545CD|nr:uncharacterized protein KY384_002816 [Bacidia gigantensis]KAG8532938.1 hypothetical protein KY384_002816 [Bacidia gigantensis]
MNPFHAIYHPESVQEDMEYDHDGNEPYEEPARRSKRRKISPEETPVRRVTRSAQKKAAASAPARKDSKDTMNVKKEAIEPTAVPCTKEMPPPITTPKRRKKTIIPSSQSSVGTPLSTRSQKTARNTSRSPLKDISNNIMIMQSPISAKAWTHKKGGEIPDSLENEYGDSPLKRIERTISNHDVEDMKHTDIAPDSIQLVQCSNEDRVEDFRPRKHPASPSKTSSYLAFDQASEDKSTLLMIADSFSQGEEKDIFPTEAASSLHTASSNPSSEHNGRSPIQAIKSPFGSDHLSCPEPEPKILVPSSQATTVAGTQPYLKNSLQNIPSSQPSVPPPMSSPAANRPYAEDVQRQYEWNAEDRVTDSQLLPESLMNDSLIGPPEDWKTMIEDSLSDADTESDNII